MVVSIWCQNGQEKPYLSGLELKLSKSRQKGKRGQQLEASNYGVLHVPLSPEGVPEIKVGA